MTCIYKRLIVLFVAVIVLVGCAYLPVDQSQIPTMSSSQLNQRNQLSRLMKYHGQLQKKTQQELSKEYSVVRKQFLDKRSDEDRAKYTLLLSLPNTSFHNPAIALHLLNEWPKKTKLSANSDSFRVLLVLLLKEQQTLKSLERNLSQKLKDEEARSDALQKQVDDIKDMEKSLLRRNSN